MTIQSRSPRSRLLRVSTFTWRSRAIGVALLWRSETRVDGLGGSTSRIVSSATAAGFHYSGVNNDTYICGLGGPDNDTITVAPASCDAAGLMVRAAVDAPCA